MTGISQSEEQEFKIVDGRNARNRRIDSDIEVWHRAREAWHGNCHIELMRKSRREIRTEIACLGVKKNDRV